MTLLLLRLMLLVLPLPLWWPPVQEVVPLLNDPDPRVRGAAAQVLSGWSGKDRGDVAGIQEWASALSGTSSTAGE